MEIYEKLDESNLRYPQESKNFLQGALQLVV